ncbi:MAG: 4a-hydroxytetrahydrobiopterin dehydratase [Pseudomonadota bacterium]
MDLSSQALRSRQCEPCEGGVDPMSQAESEKFLGALHTDWQLINEGTGLRRAVAFAGWNRALSFTNAVAWIANTEGHHPLIELSYGRCVITWTTNAISGLSINDFVCAAKTDYLLESV